MTRNDGATTLPALPVVTPPTRLGHDEAIAEVVVGEHGTIRLDLDALLPRRA